MKLTLSTFYIIMSLVLISCSGKDIQDSTDDLGGEPKNEAPSPPKLLFPQKDQACTFSTMTFEWEPSTDPEGTEVSYKFEISEKQDFGELHQSLITNNTFVSLDLEKGTTYYWRVLSIDEDGNKSDHLEIRSFFTEPNLTYNSIPQNPNSENPSNNTTVAQSVSKLEWTSEDEDGDALVFDVYFGTTNPPQLVRENLEGTSFLVNLAASTTYYWQVIAKDTQGAKAIGPIWKFNVH